MDVFSDSKHQKKADDNAVKRSHIVKFKQLEFGLLQDLRVDLVRCDTDGQESMCNNCGAQFANYTSLRRHYQENHDIQDVKMEVMRKENDSK